MKNNIFPTTKAENWLFFADSDLRSGQLSFHEGIYHNACFHAQQAVEKAVKGLILQHYQKEPPKIHSLIGLLDQHPEIKKLLSPKLDEIEYLDQFYVPTRYPDALPGSIPEGLPGEEDSRQALEYAGALLEKIKKLLNTS